MSSKPLIKKIMPPSLKKMIKIRYPIAPDKFSKYVFVGAGSKNLSGVSLGNGALISAGSIVNRDVNAFDVVGVARAQELL